MSENGPSLFDAVDSPEIRGEAGVASPKSSPSNEGQEAVPGMVPSQASVAQATVLDQPLQPSFIEPKADLIVGATGSGKTINIGEVAKYVLRKYGKLTRMASTDPSGPGPLVGMVREGEIDFWAVHAWPKPIEAMYKSCMGYWPLRSNDPDSPLVPPDAGTYEVYGFGAFEGLTSYGDTILAELKRTKASLSQDPSYSWSQGDFSTSGGNQSYYGMMQDTLNQWVIKTHLLGYERILWTALESRGKDKDGNVVYGPMIGGKQATGKAGQWFVNFFHMDILNGEETVDPKTKQKMVEALHVLFLKTHIDPATLIPFPCKIRAPKESGKDVPSYLLSGSVAEAYELLDKLYERQQKDSASRMSEIAGLRERLLENAAKAKVAESLAAEKRAKAAGLLKLMVTVPGMPIGSGPVQSGTVAPKVAGPVAPAPQPVKTSVPLGTPTIQNVRKK